MAYDNNQQQYTPNGYGYRFYNTTSDIAKSRISFNMWQSTIKITIENMIKEAVGSNMAEYDTKNASVIYLTPSKALMFGSIIEKYMKDPATYDGYGIASAKAFISINKIEGEDVIQINGTVNNSLNPGNKFVVSKKHPCVSKWTSGGPVYDDELFANLDLYQIITQLKDYAKAMNNTIAFSVWNSNSYNTGKLREAINKILGENNISNTGTFKPQDSSSSGIGIDDLDGDNNFM